MILIYFVLGMLLFFIPFAIYHLVDLVNTVKCIDNRINSLVTYLNEVTKDDSK